MGVRVAYGERKNVKGAIANGTIPKDCIIITKDKADSELLFYDASGSLKTIAERTRFDTLDEAEQWAMKYPCSGFVFLIRDEDDWMPYFVRDDNTLSPLIGDDTLKKLIDSITIATDEEVDEMLGEVFSFFN